MGTISSSAELKNAILLLEMEQELKGKELKVQFYKTYESLKPLNIFKSLTKDAITSPTIITNVLGTSIGLATGLITNKLIVGASAGILRKLIAPAIQMGVARLINSHPNAVSSVGSFLSKLISSKKKAIV